MQLILDEIEPLDANRDDMRAARNTAQLIACLAPGISDPASVIDHLRRYLPIHNHETDEPVLTPEQAAEVKAKYASKEGQ